MSSMFGTGRRVVLLLSLGAGALAFSAAACSEGSESKAGTGGAATTGGASGDTGGTPANAGQGGAAADAEKVLFAFANDFENWKLNDYVEVCDRTPTATGAAGTPGTAGAAGTSGTAGAPSATGGAGADKECEGPLNLFETTTLEWTNQQGKPDAGALEVTIPFTDYKQAATVEFEFGVPQDFSGKMLTVQVQRASGFNADPSFPGGLIFFVKTGDDWVWGQQPWVNIETTGTWVEYKFVLDKADAKDGFDPTAVRTVGIAFDTGGGAEPDADKQPTSKPTEAVFYVDTVEIQPVQ